MSTDKPAVPYWTNGGRRDLPHSGDIGAAKGSSLMFHHGPAGGESSAEINVAIEALDKPGRSRAAGLFSAAVSVALLVMVALQFRDLAFSRIIHLIPRFPAFWLVFATYYLTPPLTEWVIYRRLWRLPVSGVAALLRKMVSNELLLGYLGEVQFYAWARSRLNMATAPFGAIKDVTILSALTGNLATLAMLVVAWPLVSSSALGMQARTTFLSLGVVLLTSFLIFLFRQRLFTLPRSALRFIAAMHVLRIVAIVGLAALMWHLVLPDVYYSIWLVLATLRMLVSRLPLIPNKDVVFAGLAVFLLGREHEIGDLMAMMAGLLLVTHLVVGMVCGAAELLSARRS